MALTGFSSEHVRSSSKATIHLCTGLASLICLVSILFLPNSNLDISPEFAVLFWTCASPPASIGTYSFSLHAAAACVFIKSCLGSFTALWVDSCPTTALPGAFVPWGCWMAEPELLSAVQWPQAQGSFVEPDLLHSGQPGTSWPSDLKGMYLSFLALLHCCAQQLESPALQLQLQQPSHHIYAHA